MNWEVLDTDSGDVLASYDSFEHAQSRVQLYVSEHPETVEDLSILEIDEAGEVHSVISAVEATSTTA